MPYAGETVELVSVEDKRPIVEAPVEPAMPISNTSSMLGGYGEEISADLEIQQLADSIRLDVETQLGTTFSKYNVVSYRTQVVAGTNYSITIEVDSGLIHVNAYKALPFAGESVSLVSIDEAQPSVD